MFRVLTDEESIAYSDEMVSKVAKALAYTIIAHPGTAIEALSQVLFMVNGQDWMSASDMARARVKAREMIDAGDGSPR